MDTKLNTMDRKDYVLHVNSGIDLVKPPIPILWFLKRCRLIYAGMPNSETFSLVISTSIVYNSEAYNLYFPVDRRHIVLESVGLDIEQVSPSEIHFGLHHEH